MLQRAKPLLLASVFLFLFLFILGVQATIYQRCGLKLLDDKIMPSPWGDWPLYILSVDTKKLSK
jgi:hypothetical protein